MAGYRIVEASSRFDSTNRANRKTVIQVDGVHRCVNSKLDTPLVPSLLIGDCVRLIVDCSPSRVKYEPCCYTSSSVASLKVFLQERFWQV